LGPFGNFPTATNNIMLTLEGVAAAARHRHGPKIEDEGHLKDFDIIFIFIDIFYIVQCFF
jgi:hypothetical protein